MAHRHRCPSSCNGFGQLIAGRILNGVCVGITSSQVPVYLAESPSTKSAEGSSSLNSLLSNGVSFHVFAGYGCSFIVGPASFRTAWGIQFIPAAVLMAGLPFLPRSPRWLAKFGRTEEAIKTLADIQAKGNIDDPLSWQSGKRYQRFALPGWRKFIYKECGATLAGMSVQYVFLSSSLYCLLTISVEHGNSFQGPTP